VTLPEEVTQVEMGLEFYVFLGKSGNVYLTGEIT